MSDITMCQDNECPHRDTCYRKLAQANPYRQAFFTTSPRDGEKCTHYWPMQDTINRNPKEMK